MPMKWHQCSCLLYQIWPDCLCYFHSTSHAFTVCTQPTRCITSTSALAPGPAKQSGSPGRHGHSPSARLQAARTFFSSSRTAGCKAGHPQSVLQGLVQALQQLPADLNQGQHKQLVTVCCCVCVYTLYTISHHNLSTGNSSCECFSYHNGW